MEIKRIDNELRSADRSAANERKRILQEMEDDAVELLREKRIHFDAPDPKAASETEGDFVARMKKRVFSKGMRALVDRGDS